MTELPEELIAEHARATEVAASIVPLLPRLAGPQWPELVEELRPRDADFALVFTEPEPFRVLYADVWSKIPSRSGVGRDQTEVRVVVATPALLEAPNPIGNAFPGGYRRILPHLVAGRVWVCWKYVRPGRTSGTAFDGLVHVIDRWVWFPHPWRAIASGR